MPALTIPSPIGTDDTPYTPTSTPTTDQQFIFDAETRSSMGYTSTRRRLVCGAIVVSVIVVAVIVVVIVAVTVIHASEESRDITTTAAPAYTVNISQSTGPDFEGSFLLMSASWVPAMANTSCEEYKTVATKYETLINQIYQASKLAAIVHFCVVTQLRKGSIIVFFHLYLKSLSDAADPATAELYQAAMERPDLFPEAFQEGLMHLLTTEGGPHAALTDISLPSLQIRRATTTTSTTGTSALPSFTTSRSPQQSAIFPDPVENCGVPGPETKTRILGGELVPEGRFPWVVMVRERDKMLCAGSVMDPLHVITAAHCFFNVDYPGIVHETEVVAGEESLDPETWSEHVQRVSVARVYNHREFNKYTQDDYDSNLNDIAVLRLVSPLTLNAHVSAVCLPQVNDSLPSPCTVAGWGVTSVSKKTHSPYLRMVTLRTYNSSACRDTFAQSFRSLLMSQNISSFLDDGVMCAANGTSGGLDACNGDSGGPLFCAPEGEKEEEEETGELRYTQFGVVSWGEGCAVAGSPGFYAYLPHFRPWLHLVALPVLDLLAKVDPLLCLEGDSECVINLLNAAENPDSQLCRELASAVNYTLEHPRTRDCGPAVAEREVRQYVQYLNLQSGRTVLNLTDCQEFG